jgi:hypothetical protein
MKTGRAWTAACVSLFFGILLISGVVAAQSAYGANVISSTSTTATVSSSGSASVDDTSTTGVTATISGATGVSSAVVTTQNLSGPSSGVSTFSTSGTALYFDVSVALPAGVTAPSGSTVTVCFTSSSVASTDTLYYWSSGSWATATNVSVSGNTICGTVPLSALTGTNFVAAPPGANYTWVYALVVVVVIVVIAVAVLMMRRKRT